MANHLPRDRRADWNLGTRTRWLCEVCYSFNDSTPPLCRSCRAEPHVSMAELFALAEAESRERDLARAAVQASRNQRCLSLRDPPTDAGESEAIHGQLRTVPDHGQVCGASQLPRVQPTTPTPLNVTLRERELWWKCDVRSKSNKAADDTCVHCGSDKPTLDGGLDDSARADTHVSTSGQTTACTSHQSQRQEAHLSACTGLPDTSSRHMAVYAASEHDATDEHTDQHTVVVQQSELNAVSERPSTQKAVRVLMRSKRHVPKPRNRKSSPVKPAPSRERPKKQVSSTVSRSRQPPLLKPRPFLLRTRWPWEMPSLRHHFNPTKIRFEHDHPFFSSCGCEQPCRHDTCRNARLGVFCTKTCCPHAAVCGNALNEPDHLKLARRRGSTDITVIAGAAIDASVNIGEYTGQLIAEDEIACRGDERHPASNTPYRLKLKRKVQFHPKKDVFIDVETCGSISRFMNHSCSPVARFQEVRNGRHHTVVVVTIRPVIAGEEITVDYGNDLWIVCRCREPTCCHKHLQDLNATEDDST